MITHWSATGVAKNDGVFNCTLNTSIADASMLVMNVTTGSPTDAWVLDMNTLEMHRINSSCASKNVWNLTATAGITNAYSTVTNQTSGTPARWYVFDDYQNMTFILNSSFNYLSNITMDFGGRFTSPYLYYTNGSYFYFSDQNDGRTEIYNASGKYVSTYVSAYESERMFSWPSNRGTLDRYYEAGSDEILITQKVVQATSNSTVADGTGGNISAPYVANITVLAGGSVNLVMSLPLTYRAVGDECAYNSTYGDRLYLKNQTQYCYAQLNLTGLTAGQSIAIQYSAEISGAKPSNLPAALAGGAAGIIVVVYAYTRRRKS